MQYLPCDNQISKAPKVKNGGKHQQITLKLDAYYKKMQYTFIKVIKKL